MLSVIDHAVLLYIGIPAGSLLFIGLCIGLLFVCRTASRMIRRRRARG